MASQISHNKRGGTGPSRRKRLFAVLVRAGEVKLVEAVVEATNVSDAKTEALRLAQRSLSVVATPASIEDIMQVREAREPRGRGRMPKRRPG
jgi:hypothetical protein